MKTLTMISEALLRIF